MVTFTRVLIFLTLSSFYIYLGTYDLIDSILSYTKFRVWNFSSGESQKCNTPQQDATMCNYSKRLSNPSFAGILMQFANIVANFLGISVEFVEAMITKIGNCAFDPTSDATIAKSFKFILFKP